MRLAPRKSALARALLLVGYACAACAEPPANADPNGIELPTGVSITPTASPGSIFQQLDPQHPKMPDVRPGWAIATAVSPDGRLLAILTSGFNRFFDPTSAEPKKFSPALSNEYLFLFDITAGAPREQQVLEIPNTFQGLAWAPTSDRVFVAGGMDDAVIEFVRGASGFEAGRTWKLNHAGCMGVDNTDPAYAFLPRCRPIVGGLAVSRDGARLLAANLENDSVSLIDLKQGKLFAELDLRPGILDPRQRGQPGGSFPRSVVWVGGGRAYVASERDREIISLKIAGAKIRVERRIVVTGQPVALLANRSGTRVYAALSTTAQIATIDTARNAVIETIDVTAPEGIYTNTQRLGGASPNGLALSANEHTLLVSNGGENAVAVVRLSDRAIGRPAGAGRKNVNGDGDDEAGDGAISKLIGLVPTGWYPSGVAASPDGARWYVVNGKSETGPNGGTCDLHGSQQACGDKPVRTAAMMARNQYISQLERAGLLTLPVPDGSELARLTRQVAHNNHFDQPETTPADQKLFAFLREHIRHVIYIVKENRSYDQVLGDLDIGNGDPKLTLFPRAITPNHHALARNFVTLDNFMVSGEVSWSAWDWAVSAQTNDYREHQEPLAMAHRGMEGEATGFNRNINMGYATGAARHRARSVYPADPDILPTERDVAAPDGPGGAEGGGHLWDIALQAGHSLRNWGFFGECQAYMAEQASQVRDPFARKQQVFFSTKSALTPYSDPYFLDFAPNFPDFWRVKEWKREFEQFSQAGTAPDLMLIRLGNDHFGAFAQAIDGVDTPETQMADNDYAFGLIVEAVAQSPFARDTLIITIEDDACDGPDHVDAHRSLAFFTGPYVRQGALVSTRYTTVSVVKTIEMLLGLKPMGIYDAFAAPMSDIFDPNVTSWSYQALVPDVLRSTKLPLPPSLSACPVVPRHSREYWARAMANQDFSGPDRVEPASFNRALWKGLKGDETFPAVSSGADLRADRARLLSSMGPVDDEDCKH